MAKRKSEYSLNGLSTENKSAGLEPNEQPYVMTGEKIEDTLIDKYHRDRMGFIDRHPEMFTSVEYQEHFKHGKVTVKDYAGCTDGVVITRGSNAEIHDLEENGDLEYVAADLGSDETEVNVEIEPTLDVKSQKRTAK